MLQTQRIYNIEDSRNSALIFFYFLFISFLFSHFSLLWGPGQKHTEVVGERDVSPCLSQPVRLPLQDVSYRARLTVDPSILN